MVKEIRLTQGKVAIVDDADYGWLSQWKWYANQNNNHWYVGRHYSFDGKHGSIHMHRVIMSPPLGLQVDHINNDGLDNRRDNLRICTHAQNIHNQSKQLNTTSSFKGVCWHKRTKKWRAYICVAAERKHLGRFTSEIQAALAYDAAAREHFGEFANLNFREV